eukprot:5989923-Lingulodinium_polyedra.AAC.1
MRAVRNVAEHWKLGCGAEALKEAARAPQRAQRGGARSPRCTGKGRGSGEQGRREGDALSEGSTCLEQRSSPQRDQLSSGSDSSHEVKAVENPVDGEPVIDTGAEKKPCFRERGAF